MPQTFIQNKVDKPVNTMGNALATQVIINARTRQASFSTTSNGSETTIFAVDLVGDTWTDFRYFTNKAREYEANADLNLRNRYVRAAISNLFSHVDAVVSDVYAAIQRDDPQFSSVRERPSLKDKMFTVRDYARATKSTQLPYVNLELKLLRDIVNHPSIIKSRFDKSARETILYDGSDIYGISVGDLNKSGLQIDAWLNKVCELFRYERFCDTAKLCTDFASALGINSRVVA